MTMRLVLFCAGSPLSVAVLDAVRDRAVAIVLPKSAKWRPSGIPLFEFGPDLREQIAGLQPDLFCIASFPHLIRPDLLAVPRLGTLNVHPSLLPRHRGPDPLFWAYFDDDRETGATIHWVDDRVDAGDVAARVRIPIERGRPVTELYAELAPLAARALAQTVDAIADGTAARTPQDEALASREPRALPDRFAVELASWPAERVWHFLRGIGCRRNDLLRDASGKLLLHGPVVRFATERVEAPGTIERVRTGFRLHCADGWVDVERAPLRERLAYRFRNLRSSSSQSR